MRARRPRLAILLLASVGLASVVAGCGGEGVHGEQPSREGLSLPLAGIDYNVFITRQLNLQDPEDSDYVDIDDAPPGSTYYGVFIKVCNPSDQPRESASELIVEDTLGTTFEPVDLPADNVFEYESRMLAPGECIPEEGSIPDTAPTGGALLVYELPLEAAENRPLELRIASPAGPSDAEGDEGHEELTIELDI